LPTALWKELGLQADSRVLVSQGEGAVVMAAREDASLAPKTIRVAAGHPSTAALGAMFGAITVEKVASA
jgi:NADH-quinone oxidoreductase subunit G